MRQGGGGKGVKRVGRERGRERREGGKGKGRRGGAIGVGGVSKRERRKEGGGEGVKRENEMEEGMRKVGSDKTREGGRGCKEAIWEGWVRRKKGRKESRWVRSDMVRDSFPNEKTVFTG